MKGLAGRYRISRKAFSDPEYYLRQAQKKYAGMVEVPNPQTFPPPPQPEKKRAGRKKKVVPPKVPITREQKEVIVSFD